MNDMTKPTAEIYAFNQFAKRKAAECSPAQIDDAGEHAASDALQPDAIHAENDGADSRPVPSSEQADVPDPDPRVFEETGVSVPVASEVRAGEATETCPDAPNPIESIPRGFVILPDGIYFNPVGDSADPIFISSPLRAMASFADKDGKGWGIMVEVLSPDGRWHPIPVNKADLIRRPSEVIAQLVEHGMDLGTDKKSRESLLLLLKQWRPAAHHVMIDRSGWVDDHYSGFLCGDQTIGAFHVMPLLRAGRLTEAFVPRGDVSEWRDGVGGLCRENPLMILAVSLAFSGPLLSILGVPGGGLHFRGASSSGKTTLLKLAASVWGNDRLVSQWRATSNGLEAIAPIYNDMLLPLDEITEISGRDLDAAIYMLANGTGKARMAINAGLADQARWRLAIISSGEISIEEKLQQAKRDAMAGQEVRLIDVEADGRPHGAFDALHGVADGAAFSQAVLEATRRNYGTAGPAFVQALVSKRAAGISEAISKKVSETANNWLRGLDAPPDGQSTRVAQRFAIVARAGELATIFGLTGWTKYDAINAAKEAFLDWHDRRQSFGAADANVFVRILKDFMSKELTSLPEVTQASVCPGKPAGWRDARRLYLTVETWSRLFGGGGGDGDKAASVLKGLHILLPEDQRRFTRKAPRSIPGRPRLYTLITDRISAFKLD